MTEKPMADMTQVGERALQQQPVRIRGLMELLGELFHCMVGPPRAYFEIPLDWDQDSIARAVRIPYVTLAYTVESGQHAEVALVQALWQDFKLAYLVMAGRGYANPLLFWRLEPILSEDQVTKRLKVRCRVAIPGVDLTKAGAYTAEGAVVPSAPEQQEVSGGNTTQAG